MKRASFFEDLIEVQRHQSPEQPLGFLLPDALGQACLGKKAMEQRGWLQDEEDIIFYHLTPTSADISVNGMFYDENFPGPHIQATRHDNRVEVSLRSTLRPFCKTKDRRIRASLLLPKAVSYLERHSDQPITDFTGIWHEGTDSINYQQYETKRLQHSDPESDIAKVYAAFSTWTAKQVIPLGFNRVRVDESIGDRGRKTVRSHFLRSTPPKPRGLLKWF